MDANLALPIVMRWIHIGSAIVAIGGPFFVRFGLLPAAGRVLDETTHQQLRQAINDRWRKVVYALITLLIVSGLYTFVVVAPWKKLEPADRHIYHMLFGIKVLASLVIFFLASALAGRTAALAPFRKNAKVWLTLLLMAAAVVVGCAGVLRYMHG